MYLNRNEFVRFIRDSDGPCANGPSGCAGLALKAIKQAIVNRKVCKGRRIRSISLKNDDNKEFEIPVCLVGEPVLV